MRKISKKSIRNKCDNLWKEIIHQKGHCEVCGRTDTLNAHHIIGRINKRLRWDIRNGCLLCASCHRLSKFSAHNDSQEFMKWFEEKRPVDYRYVEQKKHEISRNIDYEEILEKLKEVKGNLLK